MNRGNHFRAYSLRGNEEVTPIDPFLGVDHAWMSAPTFPPHPHAGFSAVSYLFMDSEIGVNNRDSLGNRNLILPGGLHWTASGSGIVHEEVPAQTGKTVHMLQIFVNLAQEKQHIAPFALSLAPQDVPVVQLPGVEIRVPLGSFGVLHSPLLPPTEVTLLDISIENGTELTLPVSAGHTAFIMPIYGTLSVDDLDFDSDTPRLPVFSAQAGAQSVTLRAKNGGAKAVFFSGMPLHQPVFWGGSMALATAEALAAAVSDYERGAFGTVSDT
jgi:redox-sensitive bicupin YhaK (pirin superfamily)